LRELFSRTKWRSCEHRPLRARGNADIILRLGVQTNSERRIPLSLLDKLGVPAPRPTRKYNHTSFFGEGVFRNGMKRVRLGSDFFFKEKVSGIQRPKPEEPKPKRLKWQEMSRLGKTEGKRKRCLCHLYILAG
jgi:integrase